MPFVVCIPITKVAESADVIKNVQIKMMDRTVAIVASGSSPSVANNAISGIVALSHSVPYSRIIKHIKMNACSAEYCKPECTECGWNS